MAWEVAGIWKPWEHPDYRGMDHSVKGWWRDARGGRIVAVLGVETDALGRQKVRYAQYDFNHPQGGGHGGRWRLEAFRETFEPLPDNFDPRRASTSTRSKSTPRTSTPDARAVRRADEDCLATNQRPSWRQH